MAESAENHVIEEPSTKVPKLQHHNGGVPQKATHGIASFLRLKELSENAVEPSRGSPLSAGYDLSSAKEAVVPARGKALIPTDLSIAIPEGTYARVEPRLELAWKHLIGVGAGVIDADYRGPIEVILFNHSDVDFEVKAGDRIAQLIIVRIETPEPTQVDDLDSTERGAGGFGSTGASRGIASFFRLKKLSENAIIPLRGSPLSAGYDLSSAKETIVPARGKALIPTDLSIAIPEGTYARVASRSGLAWNHSIDVGAGVIDADYRGPVEVILFNHSDVDFEVKAGDRIAQLIIVKIETVTEVDDLDLIEKGAGGFGSTSLSRGIASFFRIKELSENAILPSRGSPLSAGYDLSSAKEAIVPTRGKALIPTHSSIAIPDGTYARVETRLELAWKHLIGVGAGVIDADYRGPVGVIMFNHSDVDFEVKAGDKIAQLIIVQIETPEVTRVDDLDSTERGAGGFGSTGV